MDRLRKLTASALLALSGAASATPAPHWVASWQASPQPVWGADFLFPSLIPASLHDQTFRQTARISLGGPRLRVRLSNAYGTHPLRIGAASVAARPGATPRPLHFDGQPSVLIGPGQERLSDPLALPTGNQQALQVSVFVPGPTPLQTFHWDGRQTSWIAGGNQSQARSLDRAIPTTARLFLTGIEVEAANSARSVVVIGDSITDGATASLDQDQRWTDHLAARLAPRGVAVVNAGISGGRLLRDGMGESVLARLQRDALDQPGVASVIVLIGINDISWPGTAFARQQARPTLAELQDGYRALAEQARRRGLRILGATLPPLRWRPAPHAAGRLLPARQGGAAPTAQHLAAHTQPVRRGDRSGRGPARPGRSVTDGAGLRLRRPPASGRCRQPGDGRSGGSGGVDGAIHAWRGSTVNNEKPRASPGFCRVRLAGTTYLRFLRTYSTSECSSSS